MLFEEFWSPTKMTATQLNFSNRVWKVELAHVDIASFGEDGNARKSCLFLYIMQLGCQTSDTRPHLYGLVLQFL
jgi:hypothetical protein